MALCLGLVALILLHGIKVTVQFSPPMGNLQSTNDLVGCTVQLIREFHNNSTTLRMYQSTSPTMSFAPMIISKYISENNYLYPVIRTSIEAQHIKFTIAENVCLAFVNTLNDLKIILNKLYCDIHHDRAIICLTYTISNPIEYLMDIVGKIWTKGLPRNIIFIVANSRHFKTSIIGVPAYTKDNCQLIHMIEIGEYHNDVLSKYASDFYPDINKLGGCEVSVLVQPPFLPYVVRKHDRNPGGIVGELMGMLSISMNFTAKYVWSSTKAGMIKHLDESDLNLFIDMVPRASSTTATNYRFSVGMTEVTFIVPISEKRGSTLRKLLLPFDSSVWLSTLSILLCLMVLSILARDGNFGNVLLKLFGSLIGVGVGTFPNTMWIRIFLWYWLLPSYVLIQSYLACLTKQFTVPPKSIEIDTLTDLVDSHLNIMCSIGTKNALCNVNNSLFRKLCQQCTLSSDEAIWDEFYPNFLKSGMMNGTAVISNIEYINSHPAFLHAHALAHNRTIVNQFIEVRRGSDYIFIMKNKFQRIFDSGLIKFWRELFDNRKRQKLFNITNKYMEHEFIECCFILHAIGLSLSVLCFIIEMIIYRFPM